MFKSLGIAEVFRARCRLFSTSERCVNSPHISAPWRAAMTTEGDFSVENSSSDDEAIAPKTKRSLRGVLLQYMLYDAFIRPTAWHFAPLRTMPIASAPGERR